MSNSSYQSHGMWFPFYVDKWNKDLPVQLMTVEQIGAYWLLLVAQMGEGDLPNNINSLAMICRNMDVNRFKDEIWEKESYPLKDKFKEVLNKPGRIHNIRLTDIVKESIEKREARSDNGRRGMQSRYGTPSLETFVKTKSEEAASNGESQPRMDFGPILADYPRRRDKKGWDRGLQLMIDSISTDEEFQRLHVAVKAYKRERSGEDMQYTMRLDSFMGCWSDYVPSNFQYKPAAVQLAGPIGIVPTAAAPPALTEVQLKLLVRGLPQVDQDSLLLEARMNPSKFNKMKEYRMTPPWIHDQVSDKVSTRDKEIWWNAERRLSILTGGVPKDVPGPTEQESREMAKEEVSALQSRSTRNV